ncbi:MAG: DinB family protein [Candidatus Kapabacteria bacterium]|nr:DinB family protein [Ignavibacteriota bacterium]MCW5886016.1 DinB family protein [Candidatus Kapabacteria bacterium]
MNKWSEKAEAMTDKYISEFGSLSLIELNFKRNSKEWSIGQIIDHLIVINSSYFPIFDDLLTGKYKTPFIGNINFIVDYLGNMILRSVSPDRAKKGKTFLIWEPTKSSLDNSIFEKFKLAQSRLYQYIVSLEKLSAENTVISSPASNLVVYKLPVALDIILLHEERHFNQALEIKDEMKMQ